GLGPEYRARYEGRSLRDAALGPALAAGRPVVLDDADVQSVVLPIRGPDLTGALHLVAAATAPLTDRGLELGRALAGLAGVALTNARQCGRLAQIARMKGDALTTMAHDLRAPLNALVGYAGLLGEGALGPLAAEQRDICSTLERQALELVDLLGAALDVARLETGSLPIRSDEFALFEPFHPGRGPERGTGFGLYIVRSFAEALGGRVAARSRLDEGTAVTVELPLVAPARRALSGAPPARRVSE